MDTRLAAQRLHTLADMLEQGQTSETTTRALDKVLMYETEVARGQLEELRRDLTAFESKYKMSSRDFFARFQTGKTDDRMDFVEWASLFQMAQNLVKRIELLTGTTAP
jgi:hypothetical protein